jgi:hypothetical protein
MLEHQRITMSLHFGQIHEASDATQLVDPVEARQTSLCVYACKTRQWHDMLARQSPSTLE